MGCVLPLSAARHIAGCIPYIGLICLKSSKFNQNIGGGGGTCPCAPLFLHLWNGLVVSNGGTNRDTPHEVYEYTYELSVGVRNDSKSNIGVRIDPRTCLMWIFSGLVRKVNTQNLCFDKQDSWHPHLPLICYVLTTGYFMQLGDFFQHDFYHLAIRVAGVWI